MKNLRLKSKLILLSLALAAFWQLALGETLIATGSMGPEPIHVTGLGLIILGVTLMVFEAIIPTFGALGIGGLIIFVIGSILLINTDVLGFTITWPLVLSISIVMLGFVIFIVIMALRSHSRPVVSGREELIGSEAEVIKDDQGLRIRIRGELWQIASKSELEYGQTVRVVSRNGLILFVQPVSKHRGDN